MSNGFFIPTPDNFSFRHAASGHGWYDLPPFVWDEGAGRLDYVFMSRKTRRVHAVSMTGTADGIRVEGDSKRMDSKEAASVVRHILRLDEDFEDFYSTVRPHQQFAWVETQHAGRLLRSGTVFEDLVKTLCTTNCSWGLTKIMATNLVDKLGSPGRGRNKAFPSAQKIASMPEEFFRTEIRAGYRSPYFVELAGSVAAGDIDPETWLTSDLPTPELRKQIKQIKGIGDYAADNLLKLLGRYDGLALDSWLRASFYKKHNRERPCTDGKIEKHYRTFGRWKGLAIWCDMTQHWFENGC